MEEKTVRIPDISCGHCIMTIKNELGEIDGIEYIDGDLSTKKVTIRWQPPANFDKIKRKLDEIGYHTDE